jgi:hypothetical protein
MVVSKMIKLSAVRMEWSLGLFQAWSQHGL